MWGPEEGEERVPFPHPLGPEDAAPLHHAHQGAGDIPGAFPVDAGHLGGFPLRGMPCARQASAREARRAANTPSSRWLAAR